MGMATKMESGAAQRVTFGRVIAIAAPIAVSNATVPLQGAIDTAIIGNIGAVAPLAAVGLGAEVMSLAFAGLNFLQIGTSGLSAQALGRRDAHGVVAVLARSLLIALCIALLLILLKPLIRIGGLALFEEDPATNLLAGRYIDIRLWGAPAELANMALLGWFAGQETTRRLFQHQIFLATANIGLNILFVIGFDWGVAGVAAGTAVASYLGLGYGLWLARGRTRQLAPAGAASDPALPRRAEILDRAALGRLFQLSGNIFVRTMLLVGAFAWMARLGTLINDATLAANVVLYQFFIISAYALDGFAIASETLVGQTVGARDRAQLVRTIRITTLSSGVMALGVSLLFWALSGPIIDLLTTNDAVRALARDFALWAAFIPLIGFLSFQLDGVFVGATRSREMRDGMIISTGVYLPLSWLLMREFGNDGIWAAIWIWLGLRALTLAAYLPRVLRLAEAEPPTPRAEAAGG